MLRNKKVEEKFGVLNYISYFCPNICKSPNSFGLLSRQRLAPHLSLFMEKRLSRFVSDVSKSGKFQTMSEHSSDRCSCSSLYMILYTEIGLSYCLRLCAMDNYINSTAWVLRCLFNIVGYSRTSRRGTGKVRFHAFLFVGSLSIIK